MSIPTCSYCNSAAYYADKKQSSAVNRDAWASELSGRIHIYGKTADQFINALLPCSTPYASNGRDGVQNTFKAYTPGPGREKLEYDNLVSGFTTLVKPFPDRKRPTFANTFNQPLSFPFNAFVKHHHHTAPDISVSFPGKSLANTPSWRHIAMVIESKSEPSQDPFVRHGQVHTDTIEQLAKNARNLMLTHGLLAAFVIGVYGNTVRLARFDHTCALVSVPFNIKKGGGPRLLQKFFWHFTHPVVGKTIVGNDPTVMRLSSADQEWVKSELRAAHVKHWQRHVTEISKGRRVEVYDEKTGRCVPYLLYQVLDVNGRLFSRATMVWRAIEDTRIWQDGQLRADPRATPVKPRIMKEAWRQLVRTAEAKFYQRLSAKIEEEERYGLATMVHGGDIGEFELRWWKETKYRHKNVAEASEADATENTPDPSPSNPTSASRLFSSVGSTTCPPASTVEAPAGYVPSTDFPLLHPQHQTYSWRLVFGEHNWHRERSHMRIIIDDVGRPLTEFTSTYELVCAIRDAIRGHQQAWQEARVMHRDVSVGNILIADQPNSKFSGFLHDYDYSAMEPDPADDDENTSSSSSSSGLSEGDPTQAETAPDDPAKLRERTGTYYFMACELLDVPGIIHNTHHDLESFYWVLLWVVVRHTDHRDSRGDELCKKIFKFGDDEASASAKKGWVDSKDAKLNIARNKPLSHLLAGFNKLVLNHLPTERDIIPVPLDYEPVLKVFDEAIAMPGWPQNDWRPCTLLEGDKRTGIAPVFPNVAEKPPGLATAPFPAETAATGQEPPRKVHFLLPPLPAHADLPAPSTYPAQLHDLYRTSSKKRPCAPVDEEELDSQGTAWTSQSRSGGRSKRLKTNKGVGPKTRSRSEMAKQSTESLRRSTRVQEAAERLVSGVASKMLHS